LSDACDTANVDFADLSDRVYRLCLAMLRREADARDAMQEAMMRAWQRRDRKRADVTWWTWCGGFAVRVCRESRRRRQRSPMALEIDAVSEAAIPLPVSSEGVDVRRLHRAVDRLPTRQREVTVLRFFMDLNTRQTAEVLDCPTGTVKSNLYKAVQALERMLAPDGSAVPAGCDELGVSRTAESDDDLDDDRNPDKTDGLQGIPDPAS